MMMMRRMEEEEEEEDVYLGPECEGRRKMKN